MVFDILSKGQFDDVVQAHPVSNVTYGHQGSGVLGYSSDGAYVNGVAMFSLQLLLFLSTDEECPELPAGVKTSLAAVSVKFTRHQNNNKRCASIWKETATQAALNRPLDPFMMASALGLSERRAWPRCWQLARVGPFVNRWRDHAFKPGWASASGSGFYLICIGSGMQFGFPGQISM